MKGGDEVVLFMGQPAIVFRDGKEIWHEPSFLETILEYLREKFSDDQQEE